MAKKDKYQQKLEYNNNYNRSNYRSFSVRFSINNESDIIRWLEKQQSIKPYLSELIRKDMEKDKKKKKKKNLSSKKSSAKTGSKKTSEKSGTKKSK